MLLLLGAVLLALPLLALVVAALLPYGVPAWRRAHRISKTFPQPLRLPLLGHLRNALVSRDDLFWLIRDWRKTYGSRFVLTVFGRPCFNISDPEAVEAVLSRSKHIAKSMVYSFLRPWLGDGLLTSQAAQWHARRKLLTPAFHFRILGQFSGHLQHQAGDLVLRLREAAAAAPRGQPVDVVPLISRNTLRSICVTAMGKMDFQSDSVHGVTEESYFQAIHKVGLACVNRLVRPWLWIPVLFTWSSHGKMFRDNLRILHQYTEEVIQDRKKTLWEETASDEYREGSATRRLRPFLDVLLMAQQNDASLSDLEIREEVDTFMFEGHDTTAMAVSWALELLGRHAEVQDRLAAELRGSDLDWASVSRLPYLDMVLKECLRLRPSVPFISRYIEADVPLSNGQGTQLIRQNGTTKNKKTSVQTMAAAASGRENEHVLPACSAVHIHIYDLHRDPTSFPDPERFDPDRFLPENEQKRHPFAYVPFSAGPRNCIGKRFAVMEVKLLLAAVVRHFSIRSAMPEVLDVVTDLVLRPREGVFLELTPRQ